MIKNYIIDAVVSNARKHEPRHRVVQPCDKEGMLLRLAKLMEECGELAEAIIGSHEHPADLELIQIGGFMINWLQDLGGSYEDIQATLALDEIKHPTPDPLEGISIQAVHRTCPHGIVAYRCHVCHVPICNLCGLWGYRGHMYCRSHKPDDASQAR